MDHLGVLVTAVIVAGLGMLAVNIYTAVTAVLNFF